MGPTSLRLGRSNLYLLDSGEGLVFIDAGTPRPDAWDVFTRWLAALGHRSEGVRALLLTHAHPDHLALAGALKRWGVKVLVHQSEADALAGRVDRKAVADLTRELFLENGVPDDLAASWSAASSRRWSSPPVEPDGVCADGDWLEWGDLRLRAIHVPGHSLGSTAFYHPETRSLFSGDHLLRRALPHLGLYFDAPSASGVKGGRFRALPAYLRSLDKVDTLEVDRVYPGHGAAFDDAPQTIAWLRRQHEARLRQTLELLKPGPLTAFELLPELFPRRRPHHWRLGLGQAIGCLDELEARGWVRGEEKKGMRVFEVTGQG